MINVTYFESLFDHNCRLMELKEALERIETGASLEKVAYLRGIIDKEKRNAYKKNLPGICFSGEFTAREDNKLIKHNGFMVIDLDDVGLDYRQKLESCEYCYACWLSPSGTGFKMLIRIQDPAKHKEHFAHFQKNLFPECDSSGKNVSRFCFESYDPEIYINENAVIYTKAIEQESYSFMQPVAGDGDAFTKLVKWITNKGGAFVSGQRNDFIFRLASACCRFGIDEYDCQQRIITEFVAGEGSFKQSEVTNTIKSAYKRNVPFSAKFDDHSRLVTSSSGVEVDYAEIPTDDKPKDIIFSDDVKEDALKVFRDGHESVEPTGVEGLDFKFKRGEITLLTGIGNYGKSALLKYITLTKSVLDGTKWCSFSPEEFPAHLFYHEFVEMYEGMELVAHKGYYSEAHYIARYDWVGQHFHYCYPRKEKATPEYILSRFLEMKVKHGITGMIIDPFNQQDNDITSNAEYKYLERILKLYQRFAQENNIFLIIVAHPKSMTPNANGNYPCPDVYDVAGGSMWNNKMDNILVYHRPLAQTDPMNPTCEFHKKKIKKQSIVGKKGSVIMEYDIKKRRFIIDGVDYLSNVIRDKAIKQKAADEERNRFGGLKEEPFK